MVTCFRVSVVMIIKKMARLSESERRPGELYCTGMYVPGVQVYSELQDLCCGVVW